MEVVREYLADERTATARTGLVGPAGVPGGVAGMSNGLGLCRRQLGQQWSCMRAWDFEELPFGVEDVDVTRAVGEEELPSNVLEVLVSSLKDDSLSMSMVLVTYVAAKVFKTIHHGSNLGTIFINCHGAYLGETKLIIEIDGPTIFVIMKQIH
nr:hypothetical protein [Tanacetum cinerariifolium]